MKMRVVKESGTGLVLDVRFAGLRQANFKPLGLVFLSDKAKTRKT